MNKYIKYVEILEVKQDELVVKIIFDMDKLVVDFVNKVQNIKEIIGEIAKNIGAKTLKEIAEGDAQEE